MEINIKDLNEMHKFGKLIGEKVKKNSVIFLTGDLGAGKTTLTQFIAETMGVEDYITSPTFNIIKEYKGQTELIHMDLYRIGSFGELMELGFMEYLGKDKVIIIEWPELVKENTDMDFVEINIKNKYANNERQLTISGKGQVFKIIEEVISEDDSFRY